MDSLVKRALFLQNCDLRKLPFWRISCIDILPCSMWVAYRRLTIYVKELKWFSPFRSLRTFALSSTPSPMDSVPGLYATYAAATVNKEEFIFMEVYFELHDLLPCQCILCTVTDVKKRPKVGQAALPVDKVGATCWIRLNVNSFLENALQLKLFRTCPTEKESVSCTAATFKSINSISDTLSYALPLAAVWNLNGSGNSIIFIEITCMYEGFIGVIALTVLGVSVDSCRLSKENVFRELTLISSFVFNIDLLCYGGCFGVSVMKLSEILSMYSKT